MLGFGHRREHIPAEATLERPRDPMESIRVMGADPDAPAYERRAQITAVERLSAPEWTRPTQITVEPDPEPEKPVVVWTRELPSAPGVYLHREDYANSPIDELTVVRFGQQLSVEYRRENSDSVAHVGVARLGGKWAIEELRA